MKGQIDFNDFLKLDLRIGEVREVINVEGSSKLLELHVDFGSEMGQRIIYAGVREWYEASKIAGRKLAFVINLAPKTFKINNREYVSEGMMLAAEDEGPVLYSFDRDIKPGAILK